MIKKSLLIVLCFIFSNSLSSQNTAYETTKDFLERLRAMQIEDYNKESLRRIESVGRYLTIIFDQNNGLAQRTKAQELIMEYVGEDLKIRENSVFLTNHTSNNLEQYIDAVKNISPSSSMNFKWSSHMYKKRGRKKFSPKNHIIDIVFVQYLGHYMSSNHKCEEQKEAETHITYKPSWKHPKIKINLIQSQTY